MAVRFLTTVRGVPEVADLYRSGLQALTATDAARWDYAVGCSGNGTDDVHWIEVHPCKSGEVPVVLAKLQWLKDWVRGQAPGFRDMRSLYVWIPSGKVALTKTSRQYRQVSQKGLSISSRRYVIS